MDIEAVINDLKLEADEFPEGIFNVDRYNERNTAIREIVKNGFRIPSSIDSDCLLFVGINPSLRKDTKESMFSSYYPVTYADPYFKVFEKIQKAIENEYNRRLSIGHLDLLFFRHTDQGAIKEMLHEKDNILCQENIGFICDQLRISKAIIEKVRPRVVVIANTSARLLSGFEMTKDKLPIANVWMGYDFAFDKGIGTYIITGNVNDSTDLVGTPVFFTGMLSGQRALDRGSLERLSWHIDHVLGKKAAAMI